MSSCTTAQEFLRSFRARFDPVLGDYMAEKITELQKVGAIGQLLATVLRDFVTEDGKRLRPALVELGYRAGGKPATPDILRPGIGVELLHAFFLIHDDIIDRSEKRRNRPTVHRVLAEQYAPELRDMRHEEREHFAHSMAMLAGDLCCSIAYESLTSSAFPPDRIIAALRYMHRMMDLTVVGEALDVVLPHRGVVTHDDVLMIHWLKTAMYTFVSPLKLGMTLGKVAPAVVQAIEQYGGPVGIAFQIQDDYLGLFGDEQTLGKPVASDVEEGKQTLLTVYAFEHASVAAQERLRAILGRSPVTSEEFEDVRTIMQECGATAYSEEQARLLVETGIGALERLPIDPSVQHILRSIAQYVVRRTT